MEHQHRQERLDENLLSVEGLLLLLLVLGLCGVDGFLLDAAFFPWINQTFQIGLTSNMCESFLLSYLALEAVTSDYILV